MIRQNNNGFRYKDYPLWNREENLGYNYSRHGLLKYIMSPVITKSSNPALQIILRFIEGSIIFLNDYIGILKNFKNVHWKNR